MRFVRLSPRSAEFQCALVAIQAATEETVIRVLTATDKRILLTHRGTLDPCAFWQSFGNSRESFFEMTGTTLEDHYRQLWSGHPRYVKIDGTPDFAEKLERGLALVRQILSSEA